MSAEDLQVEPTRCGFVALIGAPNAGKSTLVNALVGAKVTIVSHKVQTTRALVRGIAMEGTSQIVLVDTPGLFSPKRRLDRAMVSAAWGGAADADRVLVLIDVRKGLDEQIEAMFEKLGDIRQPKDLVLNKVDLLERPKLLDLAADINTRTRFEKTFMVSATTGSGVADLRRHLAEIVPAGPWHYPEDEISDVPARMLAAEITREKLYHRLHDELPYDSTVETEAYEERKDGSIRIEQTIYVVREGQRKIMLGKGGETIKAISKGSREELARLFEVPVHLFLTIKVREDWGNDPERYERMGLEFPKGR
jgi:GTP-binding protein Era